MKMPLIILRSLLLLVTALFFASCGATQKEINVSGSPFGRAPTAKLIVPAHLVVKKVNGKDVNMPLLATGHVALLMAEGDNDIEVYFDYIYEEIHNEGFERLNSDSFYTTLTDLKEGEIYVFDLELPFFRDKARSLIEDDLGNIVSKDGSGTFKLTKEKQSRKSLRDYINKNDPYKQLQHWWDKADSQEKARFKREILSE